MLTLEDDADTLALEEPDDDSDTLLALELDWLDADEDLLDDDRLDELLELLDELFDELLEDEFEDELEYDSE
jgi:hypothetical protein